MTTDLTNPPTDIEIAEALLLVNAIEPDNVSSRVIRRLAFERDRLRMGLQEIAQHSVCCNARHIADKVLSNQSLSANEPRLGPD